MINQNVTEVTFGADPEMFAKNKKGTPVSLIGLIGGSKMAPRKIPCGALQEDNVSGEMNIDPVSTKREFIRNMSVVRDTLRTEIRSHDLVPVIEPHVFFPADQLQHENARAFGCTPDYDVWTGKVNPTPVPPANGMRTGAGHVHFGYRLRDGMGIVELERARAELLRKTVILADVFIGLPSVVLDPNKERREVYGKAGAYRHNYNNLLYRIEYRTPSNFWIKNQKLMGWMFDAMTRIVNSDLSLEQLEERLGDEVVNIVNAINTSDTATALRLIEKFGVPMP